MAEAVEGHGTRRASVLDVGPVGTNKRLQVLDRRMSFHVVRHKELMAAGRGLQMQLQAAHQQGMQRDRPDETAFALDGDGPSRTARAAMAVSIRKHSWMRRPAYRAR